MGGEKYYYGIDKTQYWEEISPKEYVGKFQVHEIRKKEDVAGVGLPMYADTSDVYVRWGRLPIHDYDEPIQMRIYNAAGVPILDVEINAHGVPKNRNMFPNGVIHVHELHIEKKNNKDVLVREQNPHSPTEEQIKEYSVLFNRYFKTATII